MSNKRRQANTRASELTTYYYYTILRVNLIGLEGEGIKEIAETARIEDRNHFEALVPRIYERNWPDTMAKMVGALQATPPGWLAPWPKERSR